VNAPTGPCAAGFFCTGGASTPTQFASPAGSFSLAGSPLPTQCPPGTFQATPGSASCLPCPARKLCALNGTVTPANCPDGSYCGLGSASGAPCPAGTYGKAQGFLQNATECSPCDPGYSCPQAGLAAPGAQCNVGFFCAAGAPTASPPALVGSNASGSYAFYGPCPAGAYCGYNTPLPTPCRAGTYNPFAGQQDASACQPCPGGFYVGN
jgi:hypothetical protein